MQATPPHIDYLNLAALLFSPVVAVLISLWIQARRERRQQRLAVFITLVGTRNDAVSAEHVRALNSIDVVFVASPKVRGLWHELYDMLNNPGLTNPLGFQTRAKKRVELLTEMARAVGLGSKITHLDMDRWYNPEGLSNLNNDTRGIASELLRVLKAVPSVPGVPVAVQPSAAPPPK